MEWIAVITGFLGVLFGGYGAWRSWRTDRAQRLLGKKWEIQRLTDVEYLFTNRQPRTVHGVHISGPQGHLIEVLSEAERIGPNESVKALIFLAYVRDDGPMIVTWHHRPDCSDPRKTWRGFPPGGPDV